MNAEEFLKKKYQKMFVKDLPSIGSYNLPKIVEEYGVQQYNQAIEDAAQNAESPMDVSVSLLIKMQQFVDNAIFNHNSDAAPMHPLDYKKAVQLSKQLARQLSKCNER